MGTTIVVSRSPFNDVQLGSPPMHAYSRGGFDDSGTTTPITPESPRGSPYDEAGIVQLTNSFDSIVTHSSVPCEPRLMISYDRPHCFTYDRFEQLCQPLPLFLYILVILHGVLRSENWG